MVYFISGHRDLKKEEFKNWYEPCLETILEKDPWAKFVVGDCKGADQMAQEWLKNNIGTKENVTVYHMFARPRVLEDLSFKTSSGYSTDVERDSEMTRVSDKDVAFIGEKRWTSGTAQNLLRRFEKSRL